MPDRRGTPATEPDNTSQPPLAPPQDNGLQQLQERKGTFFTPWSSTPTEVGPADFTSTPVDPAAVVPGEAKPYGLHVDADHRRHHAHH